MLEFSIIIPARMSSTRLPGKMLLDVAGLPLIVRVAKQASKSNAKQVVVATDHEDIAQACIKHGVKYVMTNVNHQSGTDRLAEASLLLGLVEDHIVVNVQGDEPLIEPQLINELASYIHQSKTKVATLGHYFNSKDEFNNPNVVKIVLDKNSNALYFSRATIPFDRDLLEIEPPVRHVGMYAYTAGFLQQYQLLTPCALENIEKLEQLRVLYHGFKIAVLVKNTIQSVGVDTLADLEKVRLLLNHSL